MHYGHNINKKWSKIDCNERGGVVYKIACLGKNEVPCNGFYIGETSRKLEERL
jgi:hypothetical protein